MPPWSHALKTEFEGRSDHSSRKDNNKIVEYVKTSRYEITCGSKSRTTLRAFVTRWASWAEYSRVISSSMPLDGRIGTPSLLTIRTPSTPGRFFILSRVSSTSDAISPESRQNDAHVLPVVIVRTIPSPATYSHTACLCGKPRMMLNIWNNYRWNKKYIYHFQKQIQKLIWVHRRNW